MLVELDKVKKRFPLGKTHVAALDCVSVQVEPGEFIVIKGESGSGKSTMLNLIAALDECDSGNVKIDGTEIKTLSEAKKAKFRGETIGIVFQSFNLLPVLSVIENVMYPLTLKGKPEEKTHALKALNEVGLADYAHQRPNQLSGGQMQRVAIARAIVDRPKLVLADEPTANLDSETSASIMALMQNLNKELGMTFVIVTHHDYVMQCASRIIELKDGRVVNDTPVAMHRGQAI